MEDTLNIYFAGDIFDHKQLIGNAILAQYIDELSQGKYQCVLPQDHEQGFNRNVSIRNQDLRMVMEADIGLFNFDGADLDSGTVVEFMLAKALDIPSVLLRSDFRHAGDQETRGDNWNLMCSHYPRTKTVRVNSMELYRSTLGTKLDEKIEAIYPGLATELIQAMDAVRQQTPLSDSTEIMAGAYRWAAQFCGSGMECLLDEPGWLEGVLANKRRKGLIK